MVCSFDTMNFFMFYEIIIEKIGVKSLFTPFQRSILRLIKVAPFQLNPNALLILVAFKYLYIYLSKLRPSLPSFLYFFNYSSRTHRGHIYFTQRSNAFISSLKCQHLKKGGKILSSMWGEEWTKDLILDVSFRKIGVSYQMVHHGKEKLQEKFG